jgi:hypothetical protein
MGGSSVSAKVHCMISLGSFSQERVVVLTVADDHQLTALVPRTAVRAEREPEEAEWLDAELMVSVLESVNGTTLIALPGEALSGGSRYRIPTERLEFERNGDS